MKEQIGATAGKIWGMLNDNGEVNMTQLPKMINEKSVEAYRGLGWLAREDKINYRSEGNKTFVSLNNA